MHTAVTEDSRFFPSLEIFMSLSPKASLLASNSNEAYCSTDRSSNTTPISALICKCKRSVWLGQAWVQWTPRDTQACVFSYYSADSKWTQSAFGPFLRRKKIEAKCECMGRGEWRFFLLSKSWLASFFVQVFGHGLMPQKSRSVFEIRLAKGERKDRGIIVQKAENELMDLRTERSRWKSVGFMWFLCFPKQRLILQKCKSIPGYPLFFLPWLRIGAFTGVSLIFYGPFEAINPFPFYEFLWKHFLLWTQSQKMCQYLRSRVHLVEISIRECVFP